MHPSDGEVRPRRTLPDQPGQPPVREDLPSRLAPRAVRDFVGLVGDAAKIVPTSRAGVAVPTVDVEVIAQLGREATAPSSLGFQRLGEHPPDGQEKRSPFRFVQRPE